MAPYSLYGEAGTGHPRVVRSIGDGKFMVIDTTVKDARVDTIFKPAVDRVRARGAEVREQLKSANAKQK